MGRLSVVFSMKLLLDAGRLKKKRSWFHYMLWTCSDEHLFLEKFTKYFISFREQTLIKFCDPSFLSIRKDQSWLQRFQWRCRKWDWRVCCVPKLHLLFQSTWSPPLSLSLSLSLTHTHCTPLILSSMSKLCNKICVYCSSWCKIRD